MLYKKANSTKKAFTVSFTLATLYTNHHHHHNTTAMPPKTAVSKKRPVAGSTTTTAMPKARPRVKAKTTAADKGSDKSDKSDKKEGGTQRDGGGESKQGAGAVPECVMVFLKDTVKKGVPGIKMEFMDLRTYMPLKYNATTDLAAFKKNQPEGRNRFQDVFCIEASRIVLTGHTHDYIHANKVTGGTMRMICCQGPKDTTTLDFWHMIWQEDCSQIVMLCNCIESNKPKCNEYWPTKTGASCTHGTFTISKTGEDVVQLSGDQKLVSSTLEITNDGFAPRTIYHRHWANWPDRGSPQDVHALLKLRLDMARCCVGKPVVVHCSAGIGRTGTLVLVDLASARLEQGKKLVMVDQLKKLRDQRLHSIQTDVQYLFVYRALIDYVTKKWKEISVPGLDKWIADYDKVMPKK
jgi:protein tyrosine phosphatase